MPFKFLMATPPHLLLFLPSNINLGPLIIPPTILAAIMNHVTAAVVGKIKVVDMEVGAEEDGGAPSSMAAVIF